jgi:hypothetical protein
MDSAQKKLFLIISLSLVGLVAVLFGIAFGVPYLQSRAPLPEGFPEARMRAGQISQDIVMLSNQTNENLKALAALDPKKDKARADELINDARNKNQAAYTKAVELSGELQRMSESFRGIQSLSLQRIVYEAIALEISLVTEFIQYTKDFNNFLEVVSAFLADGSAENKIKVQNAERVVNQRITNINQLNSAFLSQMEKFEKAIH